MIADLFYEIDEWAIFLGSAIAFLACAALGERVGRRFRSQENDSALSIITSTQAATLGMFAILIGFSFSMANTLFEQRRALVLDEANAIGTTDLRAQMLPQPFAEAARRLLREYLGQGCRSIATRTTMQNSGAQSPPRQRFKTNSGGEPPRQARSSHSRCRLVSTFSPSTR